MDQENQRNHNEIKECFADLVPRKFKHIENIKRAGKIRLLLTQDELTDDQTSVILQAIHRMLPNEVRILPDNSHRSWVCVHDAYEKERVYVYSSHNGFDMRNFGEDDQQIIDDLFGRPDWIPRQNASYPHCFRATRREDEFLFVLAYALSIVIGPSVSSFTIAIGDDDDTQVVRRIVVDLLLDGAIPLNATARNIWQRQ